MSDQRQGSGEYRCQQCNQTFSSNEELRRHNEMQHNQGKSQGQGAGLVYVGARWADLRIIARDELGQMPSYTTADFSTSVEKNGMTLQLFLDNAFDERGVTSRYAECDIKKCGQIAIYNLPVQPRTVGLRFSQRF